MWGEAGSYEEMLGTSDEYETTGSQGISLKTANMRSGTD